MLGINERLRRRLDGESALANRLAALHARPPAAASSNWNVALFHHAADAVGCALVATEIRADDSLRIDLADVGGLTPVAGVLAAQCCLELLRRTNGVDLVEANRYFLDGAVGEGAMIAAGTIRFDVETPTWDGSFAGLQAPIQIDAAGRIELLRGTGPFLGLTETTFPMLRGTLEPGARLIVLAGCGAAGRSTELLELLTMLRGSTLTDWIGEIGSRLAEQVEPGFGLTLVAIERIALPPAYADVE